MPSKQLTIYQFCEETITTFVCHVADREEAVFPSGVKNLPFVFLFQIIGLFVVGTGRNRMAKYISGIHALNIACPLNTSGDWHWGALKWKDVTIFDDTEMFFGEWGIEKNVVVSYLDNQVWNVANHIRAILDLLSINQFSGLRGMRHDFICTDEYDDLIFEKVYEMSVLPHWEVISDFIAREYARKWFRFLKSK